MIGRVGSSGGRPSPQRLAGSGDIGSPRSSRGDPIRVTYVSSSQHLPVVPARLIARREIYNETIFFCYGSHRFRHHHRCDKGCQKS